VRYLILSQRSGHKSRSGYSCLSPLSLENARRCHSCHSVVCSSYPIPDLQKTLLIWSVLHPSLSSTATPLSSLPHLTSPQFPHYHHVRSLRINLQRTYYYTPDDLILLISHVFYSFTHFITVLIDCRHSQALAHRPTARRPSDEASSTWVNVMVPYIISE
jgi:hypothetical protein